MATTEQQKPATDEQQLWHRHRTERDAAARGALISRYLDLARAIAGQMFAQRAGSGVEFGDFMQFAVVGLIEAVDKYDSSQNASFGTYAQYRIRGAILNGLGSFSEKAAQSNFRQRVRRERLASIGQERSESVSGKLFDEMVDVAVGLALGFMLEDSGMYRDSETDPEADPYQSIEISRLQDRLRVIVDALPEREKAVIKYHYFDHLGFDEAAQLMGVSKSRISQLHRRALELLRMAYAELGQFSASY